MSEDRMQSLIGSEEIDHVFIEFPDLNGLSRSKQLASEYFLERHEDGFSMNLALLTQTPRSDVVDGSIYGDAIDYADGIVRPDPSTCRRVPWRDDAARVICDFEYEGEPVEGASRTVLQRVLKDVKTAGYSATAGSELEFYLLEESEEGLQPATSDKHENLTQATEEITPFYDRVYEWSPTFDINVNTLHHEYGAGQFEILFEYGDPLEQADRTFRFKELIKRAARETDQRATFMAKPFTGRSGSGYHLHVGLFDEGENVLADGDRLSDRGRHFVGGLLEHAGALTALGTPNLNGFKRHTPGTFSPYAVSWGYGNRMAAVRVPRYGTVRIEHRIPSADANPYLVIASTLAAGMHGIEAEFEPPSPSSGDPSDDRPRLPATPAEALDELAADDELRTRLGEEVVSEYVRMKRQELASFYDEITDWERDKYVEVL